MPSPIAHLAAGYAIYRLCPKSIKPDKYILTPLGKIPYLLLAALSFSLLPDLDLIPGLYFRSINAFHNNISHSLAFGLIVAFSLATTIWLKHRARFVHWLLIILLCYELHVIMDFFTVGRGVMILWPFSAERYEPAVMFFYGLRRSEGLMSFHHLWTLTTELGFAAVVVFTAHILNRAMENDRFATSNNQ
jgi:membrane-bound metal-dependent hydrolase YbcI (DUF457 family)